MVLHTISGVINVILVVVLLSLLLVFVSLDICYIYFFHAIIVICGVIAIDGVTGISLVVSVLVKFEKKIGDGEW